MEMVTAKLEGKIATLVSDQRVVSYRYKRDGVDTYGYVESGHRVELTVDLEAVMRYLSRKAIFSPKRRTTALECAIVVTSAQTEPEVETHPHAGRTEAKPSCYCPDCEAIRRAQSAPAQSAPAQSAPAQSAPANDCRACGGEGWGDGHAEERRRSGDQSGNTECAYCHGTGKEVKQS
jgi:hypothetical protein